MIIDKFECKSFLISVKSNSSTDCDEFGHNRFEYVPDPKIQHVIQMARSVLPLDPYEKIKSHFENKRAFYENDLMFLNMFINFNRIIYYIKTARGVVDKYSNELIYERNSKFSEFILMSPYKEDFLGTTMHSKQSYITMFRNLNEIFKIPPYEEFGFNDAMLSMFCGESFENSEYTQSRISQIIPSHIQYNDKVENYGVFPMHITMISRKNIEKYIKKSMKMHDDANDFQKCVVERYKVISSVDF